MKYQAFGRLAYDEDNDRLSLNDDSLHCGTCLEVLLCEDATAEPKWVQTRLEYDKTWYLVDCHGVNPAGLYARL